MTRWSDIDIDAILDYKGASTADIARYNRIMIHRLTDQINGLSHEVLTAKRIISDKADMFAEKSVEQARSQNRLRLIGVILSVVITFATVAYTWITCESVSAMKDANKIQQQFLEIEKAKNIKAP